ncbi:MAG: hypothetical protein AAF962_06435 [Actinomycetota bacterium]
MNEFNLFYSRYRQVPIIIAILVAGFMVYTISTGSDDTTVESTCAVPAPAILGGDCLDSVPEGPSGPTATDGLEPTSLSTTAVTEADWSKAGKQGEVPIISLESSPNGLTDAGRDLVAELGESEASEVEE